MNRYRALDRGLEAEISQPTLSWLQVQTPDIGLSQTGRNRVFGANNQPVCHGHMCHGPDFQPTDGLDLRDEEFCSLSPL